MAERRRPQRSIIRRKLVVPEPENVVVRERLNRRLHELLDRHAVVNVFGTAGAGKTTSVALAVRALGMR